jgi:hypothetical protein
MKTLFEILSFVVSLNAVAKDADDISTPGRVNGCLGIKWGTTIEQAREMMKLRDGTKFQAENPGERRQLIYEGGKLSGLVVNQIVLNFYNGAFYSGVIQFEDGTSPAYDDVRRALIKKYGAPQGFAWIMADDRIDLTTDKNPDTGVACLWLHYSNTLVARKIPHSVYNKKASVSGKGL